MDWDCVLETGPILLKQQQQGPKTGSIRAKDMGMETLSRRTLIGWAVFLVGGATLAEVVRYKGEPPPVEWVRERLWGDALLAYTVWDGVPRAVLAEGDGRVNFDTMIPGDWLWPNWPPRPQWQLAGAGYSITASDAAASVGSAACAGIVGEHCKQAHELFGQINDPDIVVMEVLVNSAWRRFPVSAPGFAVRLDGVRSIPKAHRWLDQAGLILWEMASPSPTSPESRRASRNRTRPNPATGLPGRSWRESNAEASPDGSASPG